MTSASKTETHVGLTATECKATFRNHQVSLNKTCRNDMKLSKHIWQLKSKEPSPLNGRSLPRQNPTPSDKVMQPMHDREALHYHQTRIGNIKKRNELISIRHQQKLHSQIWLTVFHFHSVCMLALKISTCSKHVHQFCIFRNAFEYATNDCNGFLCCFLMVCCNSL